MPTAMPSRGEPPSDAKGPRVFGGYEVLDLVERRPGTQVYRARQLTLGRIVLLSVLPPRAAEKPLYRQRFEREVAVASRLRHDNVISIIDAGKLGAVRFYVTEWVEGRSLEQALEAGQGFGPERVVEIGLDLAKALQHLESQGLIHRAVSPRAIFLADVGPAKLGGFQEAKLHQAGGAETWTEVDSAAAHYMAPDHVREKGVDIRADLYSLGCVLYRLVTGRPPFVGGNAVVILDRHVNMHPRDPRQRREGLPDGLVEVLDRCLRKQREHRYPGAAPLVRDLELLRQGRPPEPFPATGTLWRARPRTRPRPPRRR